MCVLWIVRRHTLRAGRLSTTYCCLPDCGSTGRPQQYMQHHIPGKCMICRSEIEVGCGFLPLALSRSLSTSPSVSIYLHVSLSIFISRCLFPYMISYLSLSLSLSLTLSQASDGYVSIPTHTHTHTHTHTKHNYGGGQRVGGLACVGVGCVYSVHCQHRGVASCDCVL
jgi:hypothetical protein